MEENLLKRYLKTTTLLLLSLTLMFLDEFVVYCESMKREIKTRPIYDCRGDERLKTNAEESTCLAYTCLFIMNR